MLFYFNPAVRYTVLCLAGSPIKLITSCEPLAAATQDLISISKGEYDD